MTSIERYTRPLKGERAEIVDNAPEITEGGRHQWPTVAAKLRAAPDVWHRILGGWSTAAGAIKRGEFQAFRPVADFDVRTIQGTLYLRYVGPRPE